ncbi:MAG: efflux RND transporter periplasmic adaptor subunit, partial [Candidatus Omnitrophica bacterium]|nr:efflux RND transporter periplasmic adaptor subunit [Candidatus Omnitrophota bacterium]
ANTRLGFARLASPLNGYVTSKSAETGEVVQIGAPVFTAIDLNDIWVTAYINERDLAKVKLGQSAYVKTDTYRDKKYDGWISFISEQTEFTPKYIQTTEERVKYVYRIKVRVDNSSLDLKPGMPADAYIMIAEK